MIRSLEPLGVMLFGSHARGDATSRSDVDVLVVVAESRDQPELDPATSRWPCTRRSAGKRFPGRVRCSQTLSVDGHVLSDPNAVLASVLARIQPLSTHAIAESPLRESQRLELFSNPDRFGGDFELPRSGLYAVGKHAAMLRAALDDDHRRCAQAPAARGRTAFAVVAAIAFAAATSPIWRAASHLAMRVDVVG